MNLAEKCSNLLDVLAALVYYINVITDDTCSLTTSPSETQAGNRHDASPRQTEPVKKRGTRERGTGSRRSTAEKGNRVLSNKLAPRC
jgi:hypothetical protein